MSSANVAALFFVHFFTLFRAFLGYFAILRYIPVENYEIWRGQISTIGQYYWLLYF